MSVDSTNLVPPFFGPQFPVYPHLEEMVRASGPSVAPDENIYPAFVQQYGPAGFRDRTPCYLHEPNGVILEPGIYDARLVNVYNGLPLYATACCISGGFSSAGH